MSESLHNQEIQELLRSSLRNSFHVPSNDPLANVHSNGIINLKNKPLILDSTWEKLVRSAKSIEKESGLNPLCSAQGEVSLNWKERNYHFPILLNEAQLKIDRLSKLVIVSENEEKNVNPYLIHFFEKEFDINIPTDIEEIFSFLHNQNNLEVLDDVSYIGNFHPHRFEIIREIESLLACKDYSNCLKQVFGVHDSLIFETFDFSYNKLVPADPDQLDILNKIQSENCVVQGPPGTGKSQVIANLLGKILESEQTTVVISEKRVALDVIEKKMNSLNLGGLCYTTTSNFSNTDFIQSLKNEWQRIELLAFQKDHFKSIHYYHVQGLQNLLDLLHHPNLANGKTILEFLIEYDQKKIPKELGFTSDLPSLKEWKKLKPTLEFIHENQLARVVSQIKTELIEKSFLLSIESKLSKWIKDLGKLSSIKKDFTYSDLFELARKAIQFSKFDTSIFKKFGTEFLTSTTKQKKLQKLKIDLQKNQIEIEKLELENSHWIQIPTKAEVDYLLVFFKKKGIFNRFNQSNTWKKWTRSPFLNPLESLKSRSEQIEIIERRKEILLNLTDFGIEHIQDLEEILALFKSVSKDELNQVNRMSNEEISFYTNNQQLINQLISDFKLYFRFDDDLNLIEYLTEIEKNIFKILEFHDRHDFDSKYLSILAKKYNSVRTCEEHVYASTWSKLKMDFPKLIDFNWKEFHEKVIETITLENNENQLFASHLLQKQKEKFDQYHSLMLTSSVKLNQEEKEFKQHLKEGKRILIKEFSKSRNHLSIRSLIESNARLWIQLLKPIWLSNPTRIATCFPLQTNLFSIAIFDEASQIPLEHSFGALQRAKRFLVAGDPQQMSPSSYFSGSNDTLDLLHQSSFYLPNLFLSYHYRSYHTELISFSNTHFYQNRLHAFRHADFQENPIHFKYVEQAFYDNRVNIKEAQEVARFISQKINSKEKIGVVAFSENQLQAIFNELPQKIRDEIQDKMENDEIFFKSVENVQGDECDELIISFGYGFSEVEGVFAMRFGPMNLSNGAKRLNVLLTRARKMIHFFASVKSEDFKNSSNETVNLIRKWFQKIESQPEKSHNENFEVGFRKFVEENNNILVINTLISIYKNRKWKISNE